VIDVMAPPDAVDDDSINYQKQILNRECD